jgi:heavy metal sensor kinase
MRSLRLRLIALFVLIEAGVVVAMGSIVSHRVRHSMMEALDSQIRSRLETMANLIDEEGEGEIEAPEELSTKWLTDLGWDESRFFQINRATGVQVFASESLRDDPVDFPQKWVASAKVGEMDFDTEQWRGEEVRIGRLLFSPLLRLGQRVSPAQRGDALLLQWGASTKNVRDRESDLVVYIALIGAGLILLSLGGGFLLATLGLRPIRRLADEVREISEEDLERRLPEDLPTELQPLSEGFNETLARLSAAFAREKQFLADASHELRTPVSVALAASEVALRRDRPSAEYVEALEANRDAAERMNTIIERLLTVSRAEHRSSHWRNVDCDLGAVAAEVVEFLKSLATRREVALVWERPTAPIHVMGDPERLREMTVNLVSNAIVHNRPGGRATLTLTSENSGMEIALRVSDTGAGIAPEHLPHIFERFYRVDRARSREQGGTGLGLSIAKMIAEFHGGQIAVESRVGEGSVFTVWLPAVGKSTSET